MRRAIILLCAAVALLAVEVCGEYRFHSLMFSYRG